jgi:hypothetical protein
MALSAGQFMEFAEKLALKAVTGQAVTATTTLYMAILTAAPAAGSDLTMAAESEYSVTPPLWGYARQVMTSASAWNAATSASPSVISNSAIISWGPLTSGATGTMTWGELTDAATGTGANLWISYLLTTPRAPLVGDTVQAAISAFTAQV